MEGIDDVGIYTDNGNAALTQFMRILVDAYLDYGRRDSTCGYGTTHYFFQYKYSNMVHVFKLSFAFKLKDAPITQVGPAMASLQLCPQK